MRDSTDTVSYGRGMVPVTVRIHGTEWTTPLFPKNGSRADPIKAVARARKEAGGGLDWPTPADPPAIRVFINGG